MAKEVKRKLTPFLCQELLYDYAIEALDPERTAAVEEFLRGHAESQKMLEAIHRGFWYADQLAQLEVNPDLVGRLQGSENIVSMSRKVHDYRAWPDWVKWSFISILSSACIAMLVIVIPWTKLNQFNLNKGDGRTVVLSPLTHDSEIDEVAEYPIEETHPDHESSGDFDETGAPVIDISLPTPPLVALLNPKPSPSQLLAEPSPRPLLSNTPSSQVAVSSVNQNEPDEMQEEEAHATPAKKEPKPRGFVYRAFMTIPNVEEVSDQIVQQITELGGVKAGEVELGWKRGTLRYFHFSLPAINEERLMEQLRAYGPVRISKDPHPRVMPEGQVRFILSIDAK